MKRREPRRTEISIEHNGKTYKGWYTVESGAVSVFTDLSLFPLSTHIGSGGAEPIARVLLRELVEAHESKKKPSKK